MERPIDPRPDAEGGLDPAASAFDRRALVGMALSAALLPIASAACAKMDADTDETGTGSQAVAPTIAGSILRSSAFPSFHAAAAAWRDSGGTLIVDRDHDELLPVTVDLVPGRDYRLTSQGPHGLRYMGPQFHWFVCLRSDGGNLLRLDGALTIDGRDGCSMPLFVRFETVTGDRRRDLFVDGVTAINARMKRGTSAIDGSRTNSYGATGMAFSGGFASLRLRRVTVRRITREAGAGIRGHQGCAGITVSGATDGATNSARHVLIEDFTIDHVDSDERPGAPDRGDMDGIIVFQGAERDGTRPMIRRGTIRNAAGRAIKVFAPGGGGTTRDLTIHRSVHGNTGGTNDIAHQHGDGVIENIVFHYSGDAHSQPTVPVGMSSGTPRTAGFPFGEGVVRNIAIHDTTGRAKGAVVSLFYNVAGDASVRRYRIEDLVDEGSARCLIRPGVLGAFGPAEIVIARVDVLLTQGLLATEDKTPRLRVTARRLVNRAGAPAPFKVAYNGAVAPHSYGGVLIADATVRGVIR